MRPKKTSLCPIRNLFAQWEQEGMPAALETHLRDMARQIGRELEGTSIVKRGAGAAWLNLYRRLRDESAGGTLSAARGLSELVRAGRVLGLLGTMNGSRRDVPMWRRPVPTGRPDHDDDEETEAS